MVSRHQGRSALVVHTSDLVLLLPDRPATATSTDRARSPALGALSAGALQRQADENESQLWLRSALVSERVTTVTLQRRAGEHEPRL